MKATETAQGSFRTTHWTTVLQAARPGAPASIDAFAQLYRDYWPPLYAYVRRRGFAPVEAEDLTQSFFVRLLEKSALAGVQREGGLFRSYLLGGLNHFLANEWDRAQAQSPQKKSGMRPTNGPASSEVREVLDCASPLALSEASWMGKRQRTAAVQDAVAQLIAPCSIRPFVGRLKLIGWNKIRASSRRLLRGAIHVTFATVSFGKE